MSIFSQLVDLIGKGELFALAVIIDRSGSAPRAAGTRMAVRSNGSIVGTVGGGILEAQVQSLAKNVLEQKRTVVKQFVLTAEDAGRMGMICGGAVRMLIHYVDAGTSFNRDLYTEIASARQTHKRAWLITRIPGLESDPEPPVQCLIRSDGSALGTMPHDAVDEIVGEADARQPSMVYRDDRCYFVEPLFGEGTVYIFGAGHVSQKLAALTSFVGFQTVVLDDRPEFANRERFESADEIVVLDSFHSVFEGRDIHQDSYLVLVTRGHAHDKGLLGQALKTGAGYIGMIGSRRKRDSVYRDLACEGFEPRDFERVHSPIGLDIGAETPEEIAVSIVAELIQVRVGRNR